MKSCPYCGTPIPRHRDTCKSQDCIDKEIRDFSLDYPEDSFYVSHDYTRVDNAMRYHSEGKQRTRHEVE